MPNICCICRSTVRVSHTKVKLHRFPKHPELRQKWLDDLNLRSADITRDSRVCSLHFIDGNIKTLPSISLGIKFCLPLDTSTPRGKRATNRSLEASNSCKNVHLASTPMTSPTIDTHNLQMVSPCESVAGNDEDLSSNVSTVFNHEHSGSEAATSTDQIQVAVNTALATQLEAVSSEKSSLQVELSNAKTTLFRIENVAHNDSLINLYTGFASYEVFMAFSWAFCPTFEVLG